jgi:ankyrin repeat protein
MLAHVIGPGPQEGNTPLLRAIKNNQSDVVVSLLNQGCNVNAVDKSARSALMYASSMGSEELVKTLLNRGAKADAIDAAGESARDMALQNGKSRIVDLLPASTMSPATRRKELQVQQKRDRMEQIKRGETVEVAAETARGGVGGDGDP